MQKISAIIITKNEVLNIGRCLQSLLWVDEIVIFDSGSTDGTQEICKKITGAKLKLVETDWPGFGKQKNRALDAATSEWILSIDADEIISEELKNEIKNILSSSTIAFAAYKIPRQNFFQNRKLKYCLSSKDDAPIRLAQRKLAKFSDDIVHEKMLIDGSVGLLKSNIVHYPFRDLTELLNKANLYSTLGAQKMFAKNSKPSIASTLLHAIWAFCRLYFLKLGLLDGWPGFLIALANFEGTFYRYAKLIELCDKSK
jgi:glycosyltransferase involved in cell wall biosynthesis